MTVNAIIKKAVERLKSENKLLTPDAYAEAFCIEARRAGILIEDCQHIEKYMGMLDARYKEEVIDYRVRTTQELIRFLIAKLNRVTPTQCIQMLEAQTALAKRILQAVEALHNKEASSLAHKTMLAIEEHATIEQLENYRQAWIKFLTLYDDTFFKRLAAYGNVDTADLKGTIESLELGAKGGEADLGGVASLMVASLVPSIAPGVNDQIAKLSTTLRSDPQLLTSKGIDREIRDAIELRIELDKDRLQEMVMALDALLDKLSAQLIDLIERTDISSTEIQQIKAELEDLKTGKHDDFEIVHQRLYSIAVALEEKTDELGKDLRQHTGTVDELTAKITKLEADLAAAESASREDFLTKLYNKRALNEHLKIKEGEFERYGRGFCIIMFDIDHFKAVNDTFGHEAGDAVLSAFGKILKQLSRNVDIVGRYGGEEFMALLSDTDVKGAVIFAKKVNIQVQSTRFMYKGERIDVTVSAGVSDRSAYASIKATINAADEALYRAKRNGRNRVEPDA